jgi:hypothetical protein
MASFIRKETYTTTLCYDNQANSWWDLSLRLFRSHHSLASTPVILGKWQHLQFLSNLKAHSKKDSVKQYYRQICDIYFWKYKTLKKKQDKILRLWLGKMYLPWDASSHNQAILAVGFWSAYTLQSCSSPLWICQGWACLWRSRSSWRENSISEASPKP